MTIRFQDTCLSVPSQPQDLCAFGYVLVHADIEWHLTIKDGSNVLQLVNSCKGNHLLGTVCRLSVDMLNRALSYLEELPSCLLRESWFARVLFPTRLDRIMS